MKMNHKEIDINWNFTLVGTGISLATDFVFYEVAANRKNGTTAASSMLSLGGENKNSQQGSSQTIQQK